MKNPPETSNKATSELSENVQKTLSTGTQPLTAPLSPQDAFILGFLFVSSKVPPQLAQMVPATPPFSLQWFVTKVGVTAEMLQDHLASVQNVLKEMTGEAQQQAPLIVDKMGQGIPRTSNPNQPPNEGGST